MHFCEVVHFCVVFWISEFIGCNILSASKYFWVCSSVPSIIPKLLIFSCLVSDPCSALQSDEGHKRYVRFRNLRGEWCQGPAFYQASTSLFIYVNSESLSYPESLRLFFIQSCFDKIDNQGIWEPKIKYNQFVWSVFVPFRRALRCCLCMWKVKDYIWFQLAYALVSDSSCWAPCAVDRQCYQLQLKAWFLTLFLGFPSISRLQTFRTASSGYIHQWGEPLKRL